MQLTRDTQAEDHDALAGENVDLSLCMEAGGEHLNERGRTSVDRLWKREDVARRSAHVFSESTIDVSPDEFAVRAQVCLTDRQWKHARQ